MMHHHKVRFDLEGQNCTLRAKACEFVVPLYRVGLYL